MLFFVSLVGLAIATENAPKVEYPDDPYLNFRPDFARSLPVQILLTGIVLTLTAVLFIHLMFTAQYHWPLAPVNYVLQLSGVTTLLISLIATIHVVLSAALAQSEKWPYMLDYIAVNVPPPVDIEVEEGVWTMAERATWLVMNASTSALIQITHIQFLTLLYPSSLEGRLIFALLGPLAVVASVMQLIPISDNTQVKLVAAAVRNVCNATLSLLFTVALFIWGLLVNRKQAWRTDGGTAAFGAAALLLAVVSTVLNLLYVHKEDEFVWLPGLMWAVILWQSFLGWWWWVGAGSGASHAPPEELEDRLERQAQRESRQKQARERKKNKVNKTWPGTATLEEGTSNSTTRRRRSSRRVEGEMSRPSSPTPSVTSALSTTSVVSYSTLPSGLSGIIHRWYTSLRHEHLAATRRQTAERIQRIRELERTGGQRAPEGGSGWGLGSFGWIIANNNSQSEDSEPRGRTSSGRRNRTRSRSICSQQHDGSGDDTADVELEELERTGHRRRGPQRGRDRSLSRDTSAEPEETIQQDASSNSSLPVRGLRRAASRRSPRTSSRSSRSPSRPSSIWWWGPLRKWRLQDSTSYS